MVRTSRGDILHLDRDIWIGAVELQALLDSPQREDDRVGSLIEVDLQFLLGPQAVVDGNQLSSSGG